MSEILEVVMIVSFGASWPMNVLKSWRARTTKGKSLAFLCLILFGYIAGITGKFLNPVYMAEFARMQETFEKYGCKFVLFRKNSLRGNFDSSLFDMMISLFPVLLAVCLWIIINNM